MIYNKKLLCSMLLPYSKHFYFSPELDYKSKQTSQINEVKMKLSIPLILHIISEFWPCWCFFLFFFFLPMEDRKKNDLEFPVVQ